jgi:hypothetical protein
MLSAPHTVLITCATVCFVFENDAIHSAIGLRSNHDVLSSQCITNLTPKPHRRLLLPLANVSRNTIDQGLVGLLRTNDKQPNGFTCALWHTVKTSMCDVIVTNTLADSCLLSTSDTLTVAAEMAAIEKENKYMALSLHVFVVFETMGSHLLQRQAVL